MRFLSLILFAAMAVNVIPASAAAQQTEAPTRPLVISSTAIAASEAAAAARAVAVGSGDSVKNGALIGAVIGALAIAVPTTYICTVMHEEGDPPCWKGVTMLSAIGAGVGAAIGAGLDAAHTRAPGPQVTVTVRVAIGRRP